MLMIMVELVQIFFLKYCKYTDFVDNVRKCVGLNRTRPVLKCQN